MGQVADVGNGEYEDQLRAEVESWLIEDPDRRHEKIQRERVRHPKLIRDLLLDHLDTNLMDVLEIGGGPYPLSDLLRFRSRVVVDPLSDDYSRYFPCPDHITLRAENLGMESQFDLAICTNALDHVHEPDRVARVIERALRPGGYAAIMCAENNAITNPHPAHVHNLTADWVHRHFDEDFETVWELTFANDGYRYGWVKYLGRRGQPAFALLMRKCSGYGS
jgi:SAM-dependent methyltransferase